MRFVTVSVFMLCIGFFFIGLSAGALPHTHEPDKVQWLMGAGGAGALMAIVAFLLLRPLLNRAREEVKAGVAKLSA
jgi:hypothetical protein